MFNGYLSLGGRELVNAARTVAYVNNTPMQIPLRDCVDCGDLTRVLEDDAYTSPLVDDAPWFDPSNPATARFYGLYPLSIEGMEDSTRTASVTESVVDGGTVGQVRFGTRSIRMRGILLADDELAMSAGMTWLRAALNPANCTDHGGGSCGGAHLCYYAACPELCDLFESDYGPIQSFPILRTTPVSSPTIFRGVNTDGMWKARFTFNETEGRIVRWGAVGATDAGDDFVEQHGPVVLRRTNFLLNPSFTIGTALWTPSGSAVVTAQPVGGVDDGPYVSVSGGSSADHAWTGTANASTSTSTDVITGTVLTNLATNPSFETTGAAVIVRTNLATNPSFETSGTVPSWADSDPVRTTARAWVGGASLEIPAQGANPRARMAVASVGGARYTASMYVYATTSQTVRLETTNPVATGSSVIVGPAWTRISVQFDGVGGDPGLWVRNTTGTASIFVDGVLLEAAPALGSYFDGATPAGDDFTYAWTGTANASTSRQLATGVVQAESPGTVAPISGAGWALSGGRSLRIVPTTASTDTCAVIGGSSTTSMNAGLEAGKSYTVIATSRLAAAQTGTTDDRARRIQVVHNSVAGWTGATGLESEPALNEAGLTEQRLTFAVPADAVWALVRLYNGASFGNGDVWWDDIALIEVPDITQPYTGPYFDGSTPSAGSFRSPDMASLSGEGVASFALRSASLAAVKVEVRANDDDELLGQAEFALSEEWARYSFVVPDARNAHLAFFSNGGYDLDQALFEVGQTPLPYFDGSTPEAEAMAGYLTGEITPEYAIAWADLPDESTSSAVWLGQATVGAPQGDWDASTAGVCDAYPRLDVLQGAVTGTLEVAVRERVSDAAQAAPYERTLYDVSCVEGPLVIDERTLASGAVLREVDFLLVAGRPFPYGPIVPVLERTLMSTLPTTPWVDGDDCVVLEDSPVLDPDCPPVPAPPRPPVIPNACIDETTVWQRYWLPVPGELVSVWSAMSPKISVETTQDARQVRVQAFPNPFSRPLGTQQTRRNFARNPGPQLGDGGFPSTATGYVTVGVSGTFSPPAVDLGTGVFPPWGTSYGMSTTVLTTATTWWGFRNTNESPVTPGQQYTFSGYLSPSASGKTTHAVISWRTDTGATISESAGPITAHAQDAWERRSATGVAPATAALAYLELRVTNGGAVNDTLSGGGFMLEAGPVATEYFDGDTPAADGWYSGWSGAAAESTAYSSTSPVDPCSACSEFVISYLPANAVMTIDAIVERATVERNVLRLARPGNAAFRASIVSPATHLLYAGDGAPMVWPQLKCGIDYLFAIDVPEDLAGDTYVTVELARRE